MTNLLNEFRSTLITWDKATSRIYSPVTANASDENGRKLVVQIVNGGQVEDLTGATLHLYWETRDKAHDGLDVFDAVDLKIGEFELNYTTGMLSNKGVLNGNLVLIDTVGRVVSERFKITVTEGIDNDAIQSENSFSSLTQALIDVSNLEQNYAPRLNDLTAQLQQTANFIHSSFIDRLLKGQISKIKLIGDSITAGVGATGYNTDNKREIFVRGVDGMQYETKSDWTTFKSWANLFRKYVKTSYPDIDFFNAGIPGIGAGEVIDNNYLPLWVDENEDVVFVMLGMNDRYYPLADYESKMKQILEYIDQRSNLMIVMSPNPSLSDFSDETHTTYKSNMMFGSREIDNSLTKICKEKGYIHISHYRGILDYASIRNESHSTYIQNEGTHPIDKGYLVMWQTIQQKLGIINDVDEWFGNGYKDVHFLGYDTIVNDTPISSFQPESISYVIVTNVNAQYSSFPGQGILSTFRPIEAMDHHAYQEYRIYRSHSVYRRHWNTSSWGGWVDISYDRYKSVVSGYDNVKNSTLLSDFTTDTVTYNIITNANTEKASFPEGIHGILFTYSPPIGLEIYAYQEYKTYFSSNRKYRRYWTGSTWSSWKRTDGNVSMSTAVRNTLSGVGLSSGDMIFDTDLNKPVWRNASNNGWVDATGTTV